MPKCYLCLTNYKYMMKTELNNIGWWFFLPNVVGHRWFNIEPKYVRLCKRQTNISFLLVPIVKLQDMVWIGANIV